MTGQSEESICAVIVTYHPGPEVSAHLAAIRAQVGRLVVVDNEVTSDSRARLGAYAGQADVTLIFNPENAGIATALNQGVQAALAGGATWVATFDQDSLVPPGYFAGLLAAYAARPERERLAVLGPVYRDRHLGFVFSPAGPLHLGAPAAGLVSVTATSGNLVAATALRAVGGFRDDMFIDCVDFEFCLRCRRAGWLVLEVRTVCLEHAAGRWQSRRWLGRNVKFNDYDAGRRYYQARNRAVVFVRYLTFDPAWVRRDAWGYGCDLVKLALFCENRAAKLRAVLTGWWHVVSGRRGRWPVVAAPARTLPA